MSIKLDLEEVCETSKVTSILRSGLSKLVRYNEVLLHRDFIHIFYYYRGKTTISVMCYSVSFSIKTC